MIKSCRIVFNKSAHENKENRADECPKANIKNQYIGLSCSLPFFPKAWNIANWQVF
jgi:hypothetical protein